MRSFTSVAVLAAAIALLPACGKQEASTRDAVAPKSSTQAADPFQRNGELLTINIDNMPRAAFIAKMAILTGVKITAEGDSNQTVSVHVTDATLRKVLSQAIADAPYTVNMTYTNLQDNFPATVAITRYQTAAVKTTGATAAALAQPAALHPASNMALSAAPQNAASNETQDDADQPDFEAMRPDEQLKYFLAQSQDDQVALIFAMEPSKSDIALMNKLITAENISSEVKQEMVDNLTTAEYTDSAATIHLALNDKDPEVVVKAVEAIGANGSEKDIPALKSALDKTDNEDVRTAINDAIESLTP